MVVILCNPPIDLLFMVPSLYFAAEIRSRKASNKPGIQGRTPFENTYGYTPDISEYTSFLWYQWIWFWEPAKEQSQQLGKWCRVANTIDSNSEIIARSTVTHLTEDEMIDTTDQSKKFVINIKLSIGNYNKSVLRNNDVDPANPYKDFMNYSSDEEDEQDLENTIEYIPFPGDKDNDGIIDADRSNYNEELSKEIRDNLIETSVHLPTRGIILKGVIRSRNKMLMVNN